MWPRWRLSRIDAALVHAVLRSQEVGPVLRSEALELDRVLLAAQRRTAYARRAPQRPSAPPGRPRTSGAHL